MTETVTFTAIAPDLLQVAGAHEIELRDLSRAVYTNRDLNLADVKVVGFDMDYTLAIYKTEPMEQLQYDMTVERLIASGYPEAIRDLAYDPSFIIRGLVVDKRNGHLLKMDSHGRVDRAYHGRRALSNEEIDRTYRLAKFQLTADWFASVDTLFAKPEICLYANLVDFFEARFKNGEDCTPVALDKNHQTSNVGVIDTWKMSDDVRKGIDDIHRDGTLKSIIMGDLAKYIVEDPDLPLMLHKLRSAGKRLFLLTNSHWTYSMHVMEYLLDNKLAEYPSWRGYFDIVIVGGRKPNFFSARDPFLELDTSEGDTAKMVGEVSADKFERAKVYQAGNMETFESMVGAVGEEILYVGDHIFGDILRSRKDSRWRTCLIVEELEAEVRGFLDSSQDIEDLVRLDSERTGIDGAIGHQRALHSHLEHAIHGEQSKLDADTRERLEKAAKLLKREIDHAKRVLRSLDVEAAASTRALDDRINASWGRQLKASNELSRFGAQVAQYACTYTSRVSNFLQYSPVHYFRAPRELMSHDYALLDGVDVKRKAEG